MKFGVNTITCSKVIEIFVLGGDDLFPPPPGLDRVNVDDLKQPPCNTKTSNNVNKAAYLDRLMKLMKEKSKMQTSR